LLASVTVKTGTAAPPFQTITIVKLLNTLRVWYSGGMKLDADQQRAYLADMNAVVSAGAGSGKTRVLAERYARLVTERAFKVHEVLTLTFTRKAASEMRERIFKRLAEIDHPLAKTALLQFDKTRISTLDSFCTKLVRGASNRYGLAGDFRVDDTEIRRMAEETAVELVMNSRQDTTLYAALSRLVSARSFESVIKELFADIALTSFSLVKPGDYAGLAQKQVAFIHKETQRRCEAVNNLCAAILSVDASSCKSDTPRRIKTSARRMFTLPLSFDEKSIRSLNEQADFFASQAAFPTIKSNVKDETLKALKLLTDEARDHAKNLLLLTKTLLFQEDILAIGKILDEYEADYLSRKRQTGLVSFRDTLEMAIDVLKADTHLRAFYKQNIKAIMIDEFQDNNEAQKSLLYLLAERDDGVRADDGRADSGRGDGVRADGVRADSGRGDGGRGDNGRADDVRGGAGRGDGVRADGVRGGGVRADGVRDAGVRADGVRADGVRADDGRADDGRADSGRGDGGRADDGRGDGVRGAIPTAKDLAPDKLFFVGDEKQSIYRFRGADVAVFRRLARELKEGAPQDLQHAISDISLNTNYRSTPELVDFFNAIFPSIFGTATEDYEAAFTEVQSNPSRQDTPAHYPPVEIFLQEASEDDEVSASTSEALAAAERIVSGVQHGEFGFGDVAVLFKSTSHQNEYERVFRQAGIPFTASDPRGVYAEGPANDFYAILRLALFPLDKNAYATVLRSPFVKLDDEAIFTLLLEMGAESSIEKKPFPDTPALSFSPVEKARYEHGKAIFAELRQRIDLEPLASVLSYLWFETGYRTWLLYHKESRAVLGHFDYLYTLALDADRRQLSAGAFLDELAPLIGTAAKTETGDAPKLDNEVLFLTVHKSKGLEFPVVVLADAGGVGKGDRNDKPYYLSAEWGPIVNLKMDTDKRKEAPVNYFYEMVRETLKKQEEAEIKRQFYVAVTRAEKRVLIFGTRKVSKADERELEGLDEVERLERLAALPHINSKKETQRRSFLELLAIGLALGKSKQHEVFPIFPPVSTDTSQSAYTERLRALVEKTEQLTGKTSAAVPLITPSAFYAKEAPPLTGWSSFSTTPTTMEAVWGATGESGAVLHREIRGERLPDFKNNAFLEGNEERAKNFGTLCHRLIAQRFAGAAFEDTAFRWAHDLFPDAAREKAQALANEALSLTAAFFSSPLGKTAALAHRRYSEAAFILPLSGENGETILVKGSIDLIYEHEGRCVVVDFKTDREVRPESHRLQLACYKAAACAFSSLPPKTGLVFLRNMTAAFFDPEVSDAELLEAAKATLV
jgi:ATP-dependent exoDNAse (exonuclease V) beta subunit